MQISVTIPDDVAVQLGINESDVGRELLETLVVEKYRSRQLTTYQVGQILGHQSRWETDSFLKDRQCEGYTEEDLNQDRQTLEILLSTS